MKRHILCILFLIIICYNCFSQDKSAPLDEKFKNSFYSAKSKLAFGETREALPLFKKLLEMDSSNANICYMLGVCYTEEQVVTDRSIYYLEKAVKNIKMTYDPASYEEKQAPLFTWYYLTIAYSQNYRCEEAKESNTHFYSLYGIEKDDYYTIDAQMWVDRCFAEQPIEPVTTDIDSIKPPDAIEDNDHKVVTKTIEYSTLSPLYGIQVGAFSKLIPVFFYDLKNVNAFMDKYGMMRYVIGNFSYVSQARSLLKLVWDAGYRDAFIVDVNSVKSSWKRTGKDNKYSKEVVSIDDVSLKASISGKVDFRIQIGAFKDSIPIELIQLYLTLDGIRENSQDELTVLTIGSYEIYSEAEERKKELLELGVPGPFIVAYNYNRKIPLDMAKEYFKKPRSTPARTKY
ncbi:MAG: SPOR domain-containing protein [Bacteroidota bacterium]